MAEQSVKVLAPNNNTFAPTPAAATARASVWPPACGYDVTLFVNDIDSLFQCWRCRNVLRYPSEIECEHLLCQACVGPPPHQCAVCHAPYTEENARLNRPITALISAWEIKCPNRHRGCHVTTKIGRDEANVVAHLAVCPSHPIKCDCGQLIERRQMDEHTRNECPNKLVECGECHEHVTASEMPLHRQSRLGCVNLVLCPHKCHTATASVAAESSDSRVGKRRRRDEDDANESTSITTNTNSDSSAVTRVPVSCLRCHLSVCPNTPLRCSACDQSIPRHQFIQHFHQRHPAVVPSTAADTTSDTNEIETRNKQINELQQHLQTLRDDKHRQDTLIAQMNSVAQRAAVSKDDLDRQASQQIERLEQELSGLRAERQRDKETIAQLQSTINRLTQQQQQQQSAVRQAARPSPTVRVPMTVTSESSMSISPTRRYDNFRERLWKLSCKHCGLTFGWLSAHHSALCGLYHPSEKMLTLDEKYYCCKRMRGEAGCKYRPKHEFDDQSLRAEFPQWSEQCHSINARPPNVPNPAPPGGMKLT